MNDWKIYSQKIPNLKLSNVTARYIVEELGSRSDEFFEYKRFKGTSGNRTKQIKVLLAELGDKQLDGKPHYATVSGRIIIISAVTSPKLFTSWATALELPKNITSVRSQRNGTTNFGR